MPNIHHFSAPKFPCFVRTSHHYQISLHLPYLLLYAPVFTHFHAVYVEHTAHSNILNSGSLSRNMTYTSRAVVCTVVSRNFSKKTLFHIPLLYASCAYSLIQKWYPSLRTKVLLHTYHGYLRKFRPKWLTPAIDLFDPWTTQTSESWSEISDIHVPNPINGIWHIYTWYRQIHLIASRNGILQKIVLDATTIVPMFQLILTSRDPIWSRGTVVVWPNAVLILHQPTIGHNIFCTNLQLTLMSFHPWFRRLN